jgi:hypothetical protein
LQGCGHRPEVATAEGDMRLKACAKEGTLGSFAKCALWELLLIGTILRG